MLSSDFIPELTPVIVCELMPYGWRGLTQDGEVLTVSSKRGPDNSLTVVNVDGQNVGVRTIAKPTNSDIIENYLQEFNRATKLLRENKFKKALRAIDNVIWLAPTTRARFNRAMILLSLGEWRAGFAEYAYCETKPPFIRPIANLAMQAGMKPWQGEKLAGKRLLLIHGHGFGDTIMMLRFVPQIRAMGVDVRMMVPPPLVSLAEQFAPVVHDFEDHHDYFCTILQLMGQLGITPETVPGVSSYLRLDLTQVEKWRDVVRSDRKRIGIAWSVKQLFDNDYPRQIPLAQLVDRLGPDVDLYSVQQQDGERARTFGIKTYNFENFADCAALMSVLDTIVSVDTAALHLAGAIGHPSVFGLLSHWASWRWTAPWYPQIQFCQQDQRGDWKSALVKLPV